VRPLALLGLTCGLCMSGCLERTITVTSEPPGALVTLNSVEVGRTPVTTAFTYYGVYDVRLSREGYEPVWTKKKAAAPLYEYPPVDLVASAMPADIRTRLTWHFVLTPQVTADAPAAEASLVERARAMKRGTEAPN
jgi:hypothetical protein